MKKSRYDWPVNPTHQHLRCFIQLASAILAVASIPLRADVAPTDSDKASDSVVRLEDLEVSARRVSALTQAPTDSSLTTRQPQSVISLEYIANNIAPTADYATIANIAPSVANVETNGPGLSEAKHTTIRGIDDGGYNVTFDGIPFGDYNTFTHHTTSYFPAKVTL